MDGRGNNLIVDIGNSRSKFAIMCGDDALWARSCECGAEAEVVEALPELVDRYGVRRSILSSTRDGVEGIVGAVRGCVAELLIFDATTPVPIANSYSTPETLGRDRLAAAVGAWEIYGQGGRSVLIVDMGSAITIDLVSREGGFEGGVISPGVGMRFRALHEFTSRLPLCEPTDEIVEVARTTREAIEGGVMEGVTYEVEGHMAKISKKRGEIVVIFTGGDAKKFVNRIKNTIFAKRDLVEVGLNRILDYNAR